MAGGGEAEAAPKDGAPTYPAPRKRCRDIICLLLYILHWIGFGAVTFMGAQDGNPAKLYRPRDYKGDYCGLGDLKDAENMILMMNISTTVEPAAKQFVCSSVASSALSTLWGASSTDYTDYQCACCLTPCSKCSASLVKADLTSASSASSVIGSRMGELTDISKGDSLFSSSSANSGSFDAEEIWNKISLYFTQVCVTGTCTVPTTLNFEGYRSFVYSPAGDLPWKKAWDALAENTAVPQDLRDVISSSFGFQALPKSRCPYEAKYCVPFPGVEFTEPVEDWCMPKPSEQVSAAIGQGAADTLEGLGAGSMSETLGDGAGTFFETIDALIIVSFWSFVVGLVFLVLLRFLAGIAVWGSLACVFFALLVAGCMLFVRSGQCSDAGFFDSGKQLGAAIAITAAHTASGGDLGNEALTGDGSDYVGYQKYTRSGTKCQAWNVNDPHQQPYSNFTDFAGSPSSLADVSNYCRNPVSASTIWCFTTDPDMVWELCSPIGVLQPECPKGYMVASEWNRDAMKIISYVFFGLAGLWLLVVWCLYGRIKLAIMQIKLASQFITHTPSVLMVPVMQVFFGITWCILWFACASFLISQVPEDYVPTDVYATYNLAAGTADTPGPCTDKWPTGFVWKDEANALCSADEAEPKCWRCGLPRYALDYRFAFSFFSFLWNNAFGIALGQFIVAFTCTVWYFKRQSQAASGERSGVRHACWVAFRYHTGSLAFGSFLIACVQFIRFFMKYLENQAKAQKNKVMVYVFKCLQCCMWCFEKSIKFLNKNAYIQMAIHGENFCRSAKSAFSLIMANFARIGVLAMIGSIMQFFGWVFICAVTAVLGYFILQAMHPSVSPVLPVLSYVMIGYLVGKLFMAVFAMAADTCLQCFITDEGNPGAKDRKPGALAKSMKDPKAIPKDDDMHEQTQQVVPQPDPKQEPEAK